MVRPRWLPTWWKSLLASVASVVSSAMGGLSNTSKCGERTHASLAPFNASTAKTEATSMSAFKEIYLNEGMPWDEKTDSEDLKYALDHGMSLEQTATYM